ncbi:host nuclease inhibitor protein [Gluconacetobacter aggeris]|uniref:Host nuclease inhibitor protein n=1 Tax=Gluconacetobacter aggeris TaxID=1286186 RepID=A0A7W4IWH1_9PROT|nr:host nuclease inhibitor protein [Gluconacetobacter aggeris]MBB2170334.1 host nuclease inhibitor protein [Gluconacetobacter aggeris]
MMTIYAIEMVIHAYCFRSGEIDFGPTFPDGPLPLVNARSTKKIREIVEVNTRRAYDGETLLVPGIPEADREDAARAAWRYFRDLIGMRLEGRSGWPTGI